MSCRLLGGEALHIQHNLPTAEMSMYRMEDLQDFPGKIDPESKVCNIINGKKGMEQNRVTKQIQVTFTSVNLQVTK